MYRQVLTLTHQYDNVRVVSQRIATIWGGASLLQMLLQTMKEALDMRDWTWDFYLNLSESDYPVKYAVCVYIILNSAGDFTWAIVSVITCSSQYWELSATIDTLNMTSVGVQCCIVVLELIEAVVEFNKERHVPMCIDDSNLIHLH